MERDLMGQLLAWKAKRGRKPLILRGVRQCGKTWLLREFARTEFDNHVYVNFERNQALAGLFQPDLDPHRIVRDLSIFFGTSIDPATTLIILDEVQQCPQALTSLKYFAEDAPEYAIASAGSMLGLAIHGQSTFPVGKVDFLDLKPVSFPEFLDATGNAPLRQYIDTLRPGMAVSEPLSVKAETLLQEYLLTGGMPEAVVAWLSTRDIADVEAIQQAILDSYTLDMAKHAPASVFPKISAIWRSIPQQLAKENAKFIFSQVSEGARAKDLEDALEWLLAVGIAVKLTRVVRPSIPLSSYADDRHFKIYLADIGLLRKLAQVPASVVLDPPPQHSHFRGALIENYVLTSILATADTQPYFWRSENTAEIDFLLQVGSEIIPIDAKSGTNTRSKSMSVYANRYSPAHTLKLSMKPTLNGNLPLYAACSIGQYLSDARS
ncbi:MAG: AAA family ATPase [Propionibacteriaceae bacterium]|nr:AAA family ATPase [Propionibacteriaceae bacterium]